VESILGLHKRLQIRDLYARSIISLLSHSNAPSGRILNCRFLIVSVTSRPKGEYETDGELFWFLSEEELVSSLDKDEFMEVTTLFVIYRFPRSSCIM
jgi:hypothetical protein